MRATQIFRRILGWKPRRHPVLRPDPVFIIGMHRSGTSALSAALEALGLSVGKTVMNPDPEHGNPKGFYENQAIVDLHDKFFGQINWHWHKALPIRKRNFHGAIPRQFRQQVLDLMVEEFGSSRPLIKDPRLCGLLPLWRPLIDEYFSEAVFILPVRPPAEVASSLAKRDKLTLDHGLTLWAIHVLQAEKDSRGLKRILTTYEELLKDTPKLISSLARELNLPSERVPAITAGRVDPALRHHMGIGLPMDYAHRDLIHAIDETLARKDRNMERDLDRLRKEYYKKMKF